MIRVNLFVVILIVVAVFGLTAYMLWVLNLPEPRIGEGSKVKVRRTPFHERFDKDA